MSPCYLGSSRIPKRVWSFRASETTESGRGLPASIARIATSSAAHGLLPFRKSKGVRMPSMLKPFSCADCFYLVAIARVYK